MQEIKKFNFKKTNGKKMKFSCGGYGGKCGCCKNNGYGEKKTMKKCEKSCCNLYFCVY